MAKTSSKTSREATSSKATTAAKSPKPTKSASSAKAKSAKNLPRPLRKLSRSFKKLQAKIQSKRAGHVHLHKTFKRSYREDYQRKTETPGLLSHAMTAFQLIFKHWKTFFALIAIMTVAYIILVGLLSEDLYQQFQTSIDETSAGLAQGQIGNFAKAGLLLISTITTGGLDTGMGEVQTVFMIALFLIMWLVTIYLLRHFLAGGKPKLRDALYNALGPFISTLLVFVVIFIQAIPLMLVAITYSAAIMTDFLSTPFYALVYFIFAALMVLLSVYLLSSSLVALVAVTAPGVYPMAALMNASDLMAGRRTRLILRLLYLLFVVAIIYLVAMLPIILIDLWLKSVWTWLAGWPIVPLALLIVTCFVFIYATTYLYRYYRWLLDYKEQ